MKKAAALFLSAALVLCSAGLAGAIQYDQDVTPNTIFGTGNGNGFWAVDLADNIEVGLRGKLRYQGIYNSNGAGIYSFDPGISSGTAALWNYEFAINVDPGDAGGRFLSDFDIFLSIDMDPSQATAFLTFDPFAVWGDMSLGDNTTPQSGGFEYNDLAAQIAGLSQYNVGQNSQNMGWTLPGLFDPNADGTYDFALSVQDKSGAQLARTEITVVVGKGGAPVPEPGSMMLLGLGVLGLAARLRRP